MKTLTIKELKKVIQSEKFNYKIYELRNVLNEALYLVNQIKKLDKKAYLSIFEILAELLEKIDNLE